LEEVNCLAATAVGLQGGEMRTRKSFLLAFLIYAPLLRAQCGVNNPFKVYVQKSFHKENVEVPESGCHTKEGPCKAAGTVFIVSSKKVKYTIFHVDGTDGSILAGENYSVSLSCSANPMMILKDSEGAAKGAFYVLEQEAINKSRTPLT
jgi:hypothetical protein